MSSGRPLIVIEHLEPKLSKWLQVEYEHSALLAKSRLVITNFRNADKNFCENIGVKCYNESIVELQGTLYSSQDRIIVLDPSANRLLDPGEARRAEVIVIGGILGDHPPRGRTRQLLSSRLPQALKRSLGPHQFSIDGSVYMALQIISGKRVNEIPVKVGVSLIVKAPYNIDVEIVLPYAYPIVNGRPLIHEKLISLLKSGLALEEIRELQSINE